VDALVRDQIVGAPERFFALVALVRLDAEVRDYMATEVVLVRERLGAPGDRANKISLVVLASLVNQLRHFVHVDLLVPSWGEPDDLGGVRDEPAVVPVRLLALAVAPVARNAKVDGRRWGLIASQRHI
jgi:hypothetical protein